MQAIPKVNVENQQYSFLVYYFTFHNTFEIKDNNLSCLKDYAPVKLTLDTLVATCVMQTNTHIYTSWHNCRSCGFQTFEAQTIIVAVAWQCRQYQLHRFPMGLPEI
jgi:hypothetical protein